MDTKEKSRRGQTIIEAMIALSVLTSGFLGIVALLSRSFFLNRVTSDSLTATYLASEGIELAKNLIDHDVYAHLAIPPQGAGWDTTFGAGGNYELDYATCTSGACIPTIFTGSTLKFDPATGRYSYSGPNPTGFARLIRITVPNANEIVVSSIVTWSTGILTSQSIDLEDHFYNWRS